MTIDLQSTDVREIGARMFDLWSAMWNGDQGLADQIMAPEFRLRYAQPGADEFDGIRRRDQLTEKIEGFRRERSGLSFAAEGEAVVDLELRDGLPNGKIARPYLACFTDETGRDLRISGIDMLRIENGLIAEVWSVSGGRSGRAFWSD
ncbi:hypothetical protein [Actinomadura sp. 21ATH]|uniref:hypothetical protein n=1 Tax=Actinomadura sp. 21ATH TaxID=1735444 RepID=UPI0035BEF9F7